MNEEIKRLPNGDFTREQLQRAFDEPPPQGWPFPIADLKTRVSFPLPTPDRETVTHGALGPLPQPVKIQRLPGSPADVLRLMCGDKVLGEGDAVTCDAEGCESGCACPGDCVTQTTVAAKPPAAPPPQGTWPFPTKAVRPPHTCVTCRHVKRHFYDDPCNHCFAVAGRPKWEAVPPPAAPLA